MVRQALRRLAIGALAVVVPIGAYLAAAVAGTLVTSGDDRGDGSVTIHVVSNGFHSDFVLPTRAPGTYDALPIAACDFPGALEAADYLIVGWGSETAYLNVPDLADLTPAIAARSLAFDRSVMHVQPYSGPVDGPGIYRLEIGADRYARLLAFIADTFALDDHARAAVIPGRTYGFGDIFYRAKPRFSFLYTCNAWTGEALRRAGVPVGVWTVFPQSLEWGLDRM